MRYGSTWPRHARVPASLAGSNTVAVPTGKLAGSALRMDHGVQNLMKLAGLSLPDAVTLATVNPARIGNVPGRKNGMVKGDRADFVLFRFDPATHAVEVAATWLSGRRVYG